MMNYILSLDQGTTSSRAIIFDENGAVQNLIQREISLTYPQDGWVEQNPQELVDSIFECMKQVLAADDQVSRNICSIGITNQRETTIVWDKNTGKPVYNAIVWQDRRTSKECARLKEQGLEEEIRKKTGLLLDPYFSATKIKWILESVGGAKAQAENGDLLFGTVDTYLLWHLTGGKVHATDPTNASRTMLYNINGQEWDAELLDIFGVPRDMLPIVLDNVSDFGQIDSGLFGLNLSINGMAGDQQAALIGQACFDSGMVKSTYGTGCFALMNIGDKPILSKHKMLTTIGIRYEGKTQYALEGSIFNAGTAIQFLRDNFEFFEHAKETEDMANSVYTNGGVYFVPAFTGLGAPYWNPEARGVICGITRDTRKEHIVRAALEAQAYQTRDLFSAMQEDSGQDIKLLRVDGGLVSNNFMCQFLSDILGVAITVPRVTESTAWGAACLAGIGSGIFSSLDDVSARWNEKKQFLPSMDQGDVDHLYSMWKSAVEKSY